MRCFKIYNKLFVKMITTCNKSEQEEKDPDAKDNSPVGDLESAVLPRSLKGYI